VFISLRFDRANRRQLCLDRGAGEAGAAADATYACRGATRAMAFLCGNGADRVKKKEVIESLQRSRDDAEADRQRLQQRLDKALAENEGLRSERSSWTKRSQELERDVQSKSRGLDAALSTATRILTSLTQTLAEHGARGDSVAIHAEAGVGAGEVDVASMAASAAEGAAAAVASKNKPVEVVLDDVLARCGHDQVRLLAGCTARGNCAAGSPQPPALLRPSQPSQPLVNPISQAPTARSNPLGVPFWEARDQHGACQLTIARHCSHLYRASPGPPHARSHPAGDRRGPHARAGC
jgi:hypothetical protein